MKVKAWLIPIAALHLADLLISGSAGISCEANPLMRYIWAEFGFLPLIGIKIVAVAIYYPAILICAYRANPYRKVLIKVTRAVLVGSTFVLSAVVVWNLLQAAGRVQL